MRRSLPEAGLRTMTSATAENVRPKRQQTDIPEICCQSSSDGRPVPIFPIRGCDRRHKHGARRSVRQPLARYQDRHGCLHHRSEALALKRHHYLFTHLLPYDYPDLTLSGGAGVAVLRTARAAADRPFRCSPAVIGLVALAGGWEEEPGMVGSTALKARRPCCRWRLDTRPGLISPKCR